LLVKVKEEIKVQSLFIRSLVTNVLNPWLLFYMLFTYTLHKLFHHYPFHVNVYVPLASEHWSSCCFNY